MQKLSAELFVLKKSIANLGGVAFALGEGSVPVGRLATVKCVVTYCSRHKKGGEKRKKTSQHNCHNISDFKSR